MMALCAISGTATTAVGIQRWKSCGRKGWAQMANFVKVNKPCKDCGVLMENVHPRRQLCIACSKKRRNISSAIYREAHRTPRKEYTPPVQNTNKKHCKGCYYWFGINAGCDCCNYIFVEGKRRPCPPGKDCTVKKPKKKGKKRLFMLGGI